MRLSNRRRRDCGGSFSRLGALALAAAVGGVACDRDPAPPGEPPPRPERGEPPASAGSVASPPPASAAAPSASAAAEPAPLSGRWEGSYDAKKGSIVLPPKVPDKTWAKDDGKSASGPGKISITIGPNGEITGTADGALGKSSLTGRMDGEMLRASVFPVDPAVPPAVTGVLVGKVHGDVIAGELRVAGGADASIIRESKVELRRK